MRDWKVLTFHEDSDYNQPIECPPGLKKLVLGRRFSWQLTLPPGLREVLFDCNSEFNQPIILPASIVNATFGDLFDQSLRVGGEIEELELGHRYNKPLDLKNCRKLRILKIGRLFNQTLELPQTIRGKLSVSPCLEDLTFECEGDFNQILDLPQNCLKKLYLPDKFNRPIDLREGLNSVSFGVDFNVPVRLPTTVEDLEFAWNGTFNHQIDLPRKAWLVC